jgi:hypothetical protein
MKHTSTIRLGMLLCILGFVTSVTAQQDMTGIKTVQAYYKDKLREFKAYDAKGNCIFEKSSPSAGTLLMNVYEYDAKGKPKRTLNCAIVQGTLQVNELKYFPTKIEYWQPPYTVPHPAPDPAMTKANLTCSMTGFPNTPEELLSHPPLKAIVDSKRFKYQEDKLNAAGQPLTATGYDQKGQAVSWETSTYDAQGHCVRIKSQLGSSADDYSEYLMEYDADGNETKKVSLSVYGKRVDTLHVVKSEYVDQCLVKRSSYSPGVLSKVETFQYDRQNQLIREDHFANKSTTPTRYYLYTRDPKGLPLKEEAYDMKTGTPALHSVTRWEYVRW